MKNEDFHQRWRTFRATKDSGRCLKNKSKFFKGGAHAAPNATCYRYFRQLGRRYDVQMQPIAPPRSAAGLLALFHALPRSEQVAFLAALIRAGLMPSLRIVRPWNTNSEAPDLEPPLAA